MGDASTQTGTGQGRGQAAWDTITEGCGSEEDSLVSERERGETRYHIVGCYGLLSLQMYLIHKRNNVCTSGHLITRKTLTNWTEYKENNKNV